MKGTITIELRTEHTADTGSGLPDLGHDAYWLKKRIPMLLFADVNGKERPIGEKYEIVRVSTEIASGTRRTDAATTKDPTIGL